ncbi:MAG: hypothetical protein RLY83_380 [Actinomycetota bacterium]|jgi:copper(I)-binding protein
MIKKLIAVLAVLFSVVSLSGCAPAGEHNHIIIKDAWVRSSEYSAKAGGMTGIFGQFTNTTTETVTLIGGTTDMSMMVQTHEVVNGMMQEKKGGIEIKPGETVTLDPGGLHIMIMDIAKPIVAGDKFEFTFQFKGADAQTITLTAKDSAGGDETYNK